MAAFALGALLASSNVIAAEENGTLRVEILGAAPSTGQILGSLFNSEASYMTAPYAESSAPVDQSGNAALIFNDVPPGAYAVSIVYDEDNVGELDTGFFGIPSEAFGFSNDAKASFGPPPYAEARFIVSEDARAIRINLDEAE